MTDKGKKIAALLLAAAVINLPPAPAVAGNTDTDQAVEKITDIGKAVIDMAGDAAGKAGASIKDKLNQGDAKKSAPDSASRESVTTESKQISPAQPKQWSAPPVSSASSAAVYG